MGFLLFNAPLPKAKIFMGDCGSQFLGFLLALLPLLGRQDSPAALPVPYAMALLLIPIFDIIAAVWRRIRDGQKVFSPDKSHTHHKLMNLGLDALRVNVVLCSLQVIIGVVVFISIYLEGMLSLYVLSIAYLLVIAFFSTIHFKNRALNKAASSISNQ
jgi:UDP-GlcNAc:undecaprenyl-phosphate GlcNAc-1-phosphate transferase